MCIVSKSSTWKLCFYLKKEKFVLFKVFFFSKILFMYSWETHKHREKQAPCREPDTGLHPGSPGSHPRLQAAPNRCTTGAAPLLVFLSFFSFSKILLIHERHKERCRERHRGRSRLPQGSLMQDSIPGPWNHDLSPRQMLNLWATWAPCPSALK